MHWTFREDGAAGACVSYEDGNETLSKPGPSCLTDVSKHRSLSEVSRARSMGIGRL